MLDVKFHARDVLINPIEVVDMGMGIAVGRCLMPIINSLYEVWCGYARIVIFADRRGRNEGR